MCGMALDWLKTPMRLLRSRYPVKHQRGLEGCPVRIVVRLHSNRDFYSEPEPSFPRLVGRPRRHGKKFDLKDPADLAGAYSRASLRR